MDNAGFFVRYKSSIRAFPTIKRRPVAALRPAAI